jgi:trigger factor
LSGCSGSSSKPASDTSTAEAAAATESVAAEEAVEEAEETIEDEAAAETNSVYQQDLAIEVSDKNLADNKASDFVTIGDYKALNAGLPEDTAAESGMTANIAFAGTVVGEDAPRDGMTADSYDLELGSGTFIPGFEDALIGHKAGETVEFTIPFPENYGETTLAGKDTDWTVTINSLSKGSVTSLFGDFVNAAEISAFPKDLYDEVTAYVTAIYTKSAESNEQSLEDFLASNNIDMEPDIRSQCRTWLVSSSVLEAEGVTEDSQEYKDMMSRILEVYGYKTLDAATGSGIPEAFIRSATASQLAIQIIEKNGQS